MWALRGLGSGGAPAVGPRQQSVEAVMGAGVVPFVVDVTVVRAGAGERSLVDKQGAGTTAVSGAIQRGVLGKRPKCEAGDTDKGKNLV